MSSELLNKYDVPAPRYTSYPTVPYWNDDPTSEEWVTSLRKYFSQDHTTWSMYIHIPFCETLCTFCGCNTIITRDHKRENPYLENLIKEWKLYVEKVPEIKTKPLKELHLGGGTPTFFSAQNLSQLISEILKDVTLAEDFEGGIEVDPRRTKEDQLQALRELGFCRVSMGVQDFDPEVQRLVNRIQPESMTYDLTQKARALGYSSVNYDLIYGLPKQTPESIEVLAQKTLQHKPDRIALYSFAMVPWIKPTHRIYKDEDLPQGADKRRLYEIARNILTEGGYVEIGMDHFALKTDSLYSATENQTLHRNFMGYTPFRTNILLGLGVSSISETPDCFHQNEKKLPVYERMLEQAELTTFRGHKLTALDQRRREQILNLMTLWEAQLDDQVHEERIKEYLTEMIADGLVEVKDLKMRITDKGQPFLRNACMALDERLREVYPDKKIFSQSL
ncbi:MAG: oxygen-independent coproporphyrinogen III oxidase [Bdellovibrionaceae bacterium]|nr:oxygen-independent coproporphyrinogen III oxidase [Pseudobdellovibrionaceae bacterium]